MGQHLEEIRDLALNDPTTRRVLDSVRYGNLDYVTAMEVLALTKHQEVEILRQRLIREMHSKESTPIKMSLDSVCKSISECNTGMDKRRLE